MKSFQGVSIEVACSKLGTLTVHNKMHDSTQHKMLFLLKMSRISRENKLEKQIGSFSLNAIRYLPLHGGKVEILEDWIRFLFSKDFLG